MSRSCACEGRNGNCRFCGGLGTLPDEIALAAVTALHKLAVQTRYGINLPDYIPTAREAYSAVELFLQSDNAKRNPDFSRTLANTVKWYKAADTLYRHGWACANSAITAYHIQGRPESNWPQSVWAQGDKWQHFEAACRRERQSD